MGLEETVKAALGNEGGAPSPIGMPLPPVTMEILPQQVAVGKAPDGERLLMFQQFPFQFLIHVSEDARKMIVKEFSGGVVLPT